MLHIGALLLGVLPLLPSAFGADIAAAPAASGRDAKTSQTPNGFKPLVKDDRTATPLLAPQSSEGEQRIKQFQLAPGLSVKLWAAEPQLANPVAFSVDEQGRVFTSETYRYRTSVLDIRHYMFMLEDDLASRTVEDRLAQIRKWFGPEGEQALSRETEVIRIGSGVLARNGQVWFTEIPSLWHIGPAGSVRGDLPKPKEAALQSQPKVHPESLQAQAILQGFGVRFSFTGHDLHGLIFGPDGRLYFSCGDRGAHVVTQEGTVIDLPDEGAVFRCEPDGSKLEVVHRGLRNPQELAFNDEGDLFTGDNDSDQGDRERWVQVVEGADSGWRVGHQHAPLGNAGLWNLERLWVPHFEGQSASILTPIANIGDGPSGLVHDSGTSLPRTLRGRFLLAYFKGTSAKSGISSLQQQPAGSTYELVAHDPLVWNSLVPDVDLGPDGSIFFADWHEGRRSRGGHHSAIAGRRHETAHTRRVGQAAWPPGSTSPPGGSIRMGATGGRIGACTEDLGDRGTQQAGSYPCHSRGGAIGPQGSGGTRKFAAGPGPNCRRSPARPSHTGAGIGH